MAEKKTVKQVMQEVEATTNPVKKEGLQVGDKVVFGFKTRIDGKVYAAGKPTKWTESMDKAHKERPLHVRTFTK